MLNVQFMNKHTENYGALKEGDLFINPDFPRRVFIYTDSNPDALECNDCIDLVNGVTYNFTTSTPIIRVKNAKLIVED